MSTPIFPNVRQPEEKQKILLLLDHRAKCARNENGHFLSLAASLLMLVLCLSTNITLRTNICLITVSGELARKS